ncbi:MAG: hypothetical protein KDJ65_35840 [Anaerolineae bacterium]|nr:hypothetical protein [Anaerolineae bacterium]
MLLGKIVRSSSHVDYVCQVYSPGEVEQPPVPADYGFGTFVRIALETSSPSWLVGLVYDTVLLNPDFGNLGPRLSPQAELAVFSPDYLQEKAILIGITALGILTESDQSTQGVPMLAALTDALVEKMTDDQIKIFHQGNPSLKLAYMPLLMSQGSPLTLHLLRDIINRLHQIFPEQSASLTVLQRELIWQSQVAPFGGRS